MSSSFGLQIKPFFRESLVSERVSFPKATGTAQYNRENLLNGPNGFSGPWFLGIKILSYEKTDKDLVIELFSDGYSSNLPQ